MTVSPHEPERRAAPALELLGRAAAGRLRDVAVAVRRLDGFSPGDPGGQLPGPTRDDVRELVLRALRLAADPDNSRLLRAVDQGAHQVTELVELTGRSRLVLWESIGDLVSVGLLERDPPRDEVTLTGAGRALLLLVDELASAGEQP